MPHCGYLLRCPYSENSWHALVDYVTVLENGDRVFTIKTVREYKTLIFWLCLHFGINLGQTDKQIRKTTRNDAGNGKAACCLGYWESSCSRSMPILNPLVNPRWSCSQQRSFTVLMISTSYAGKRCNCCCSVSYPCCTFSLSAPAALQYAQKSVSSMVCTSSECISGGCSAI